MYLVNEIQGDQVNVIEQFVCDMHGHKDKHSFWRQFHHKARKKPSKHGMT